nr:retrovirus-related Pol polyprotein from transposon TNT 1-94 [Tanacetum cinerariifolium]
MLSITKLDVKKFNGSKEFGLWRVKMRCLLIQHGWEAMLDPFPGTMTDANKTAALITDVYKKAHSALFLCLDNKVLREVNKEDSAAGVWLKLETLYMIKSLANKLYLKKKLRTFYMDSGKKLSEHIYEFNKLIGDLTNIDVDIDDKDQALMLLTSLPPSYDNFVETLLYERESLTLEDVLFSLNSRELKKRTHAKDDGDGLYLRERPDHQSNQGRGSSRSKSKGTRKSTGFIKKNVGQGSGMHSEGYDNGDLLMEVSEERFLEWIINSSGSFHMTPRRDFLFIFKEFNGGTVLLGNNRACASMGIGNVRVQMKDGSSFMLENVRYIPELKRNLISLGTLDRKATPWAELGKASVGIQEKKVLHRCGINTWVTLVKQACMNWIKERSPSTILEKKIPMDLRSGHPRLDDVKPKIIISKEVVFNESLMYKDTLKGAGVADSGKEVEFEVELQGIRVEPTQKRTTFIPARYKDEGNVSLSRPSGSKVDDMAAYAFAIAKEEDTHEPITFQEVINSSKKDEWVHAMEEEMSSLKKNHTWELVDQPPDYELKQLDVKTAFLHDDMLIACKSKSEIEYTKDLLRKEFDMNELGPARKILDNGKYVSASLGAHFKVSLKDCLSSDWDVERMSKVPYANVVGSLMYLMVCTRPDIVYAVSIVSKDQRKHIDVDGFVDADYAKDPDKGRSITGYVFMVHGSVSWYNVFELQSLFCLHSELVGNALTCIILELHQLHNRLHRTLIRKVSSSQGQPKSKLL